MLFIDTLVIAQNLRGKDSKCSLVHLLREYYPQYDFCNKHTAEGDILALAKILKCKLFTHVDYNIYAKHLNYMISNISSRLYVPLYILLEYVSKAENETSCLETIRKLFRRYTRKFGTERVKLISSRFYNERCNGNEFYSVKTRCMFYDYNVRL